MNSGTTRSFSFINKLPFLLLLLLFAMACKKDDDKGTQAPLQIESYYPNSGKGGTLVTILGDGFDADRSENIVKFGGMQAEVLNAKANELVVRAPFDGSTGTITLSRGNSTVDVGVYTYQELSVQRLSPSRAQQGAIIRVVGEGFAGLTGPAAVKINQKDVAVVSVVDTVMEVLIPEALGSGPVHVSVDGQEADGPVFTFMAIHEISPLTGGAGTRIRVSGEGFDEVVAGNSISINGKEGTVLEANGNELLVQAPDDVETGYLVVSVDGESIQGPVFTVVPLPRIETVSPLSGPIGTQMVIRGQYFSEAENETKVHINGVEVPVTSASANEIRLTVPEGTGSGKVAVIVNDQQTEGPDFKVQNLGISSVSPDNGLAGTQVTISGVGFSAVAAQNYVSFNGVQATVVSASPNSITVTAPQGLTTGELKVGVDGLEAIAPAPFKRAGVMTIASGQLNISTAGGSMVLDQQDNLYVLEADRHRIVKITPDGQVLHFAGSTTGTPGFQDGTGDGALFRLNASSGLAIDAQQNLYLSDAGNRALRRISPQGVTVTLIPDFGSDIGKMAMRANGQLYIARYGVNSMWVVSFSTSTYSSVTAGYTFLTANPFTVDVNGDIYNIYNTGTNANRIRAFKSVTATSSVQTLGWVGSTASGYVDAIGAAARFNKINAVVPYDQQTLLVLDANNYALRLVKLATQEVSTLVKFSQGNQDGDFRAARFSNAMQEAVVASDGSIYILDLGNRAVRKVFFE